MANGEWLTQLLSGLGGAFTGEVAARGRLAEEQEYKRRQDEAARQREQERQLSELRRGLLESFSPENAKAAAMGGLPMSEVTAIGRLSGSSQPTAPRYSSRNVGAGGEVYYTDPTTGRSIRAQTPEGTPMRERVPSTATGTERGLTPSQRAQGIGFLTSFFAEPGQTMEEKMRRSSLFTSLQQQHEDPSELGYALMQAERLRRKPATSATRTGLFTRSALPPDSTSR